jgi:hypothetical protein
MQEMPVVASVPKLFWPVWRGGGASVRSDLLKGYGPPAFYLDFEAFLLQRRG